METIGCEMDKHLLLHCTIAGEAILLWQATKHCITWTIWRDPNYWKQRTIYTQDIKYAPWDPLFLKNIVLQLWECLEVYCHFLDLICVRMYLRTLSFGRSFFLTKYSLTYKKKKNTNEIRPHAYAIRLAKRVK